MKVLRVAMCLIVCVMAVGQNASETEEFAYVRQTIKSSRSYVPKNGLVPDKDTAIAVAYAIAIPVYGKDEADSEKPFRAQLKDGKWVVLGTLHPSGVDGGTIIVQIDQPTGRIDYVSHSM